MTGLYHYPPLWLHRIPAGWKLMALAALSIGITQTSHTITLGAALSGALAIYLTGRLGRRLRMFLPLAPILLVIFLTQLYVGDVSSATAAVLRIAIMILLADLVTMSTSTQDMMDALAPLLSPFHLIGLRRETIAFAVAFTIRLVPLLLSLWLQQSEAYRARTGRRGSWRLVAPYLANVMRISDRLAESLDARGFGASNRRGGTGKST